MARREILIVLACAAFVYASEAEDSEQKKRGAGKTTLNAIPTGAQKSDYTYNIYSQNPSTSSLSSQSYQPQVPNSFYPNQGGNQYYVSGNQQTENAATHAPPQQLSFVAPHTSSQFVPLNFIPNPGYQNKYQLPSKSGNIHLAIIQQPTSFPPSPFLHYPQNLFSPASTNHVNPHANPLINSISPQGHFSFAQNYPSLSLSNPYLSQPSAMLVVPQAAQSLYNSLVYPNPTQSFYNYYPSNSQAKYSYYGTQSASPSEYDKAQNSVSQSSSKEDSDISVQNAEYITPADASTSYKNAYSGSRGSSYTKLR